MQMKYGQSTDMDTSTKIGDNASLPAGDNGNNTTNLDSRETLDK